MLGALSLPKEEFTRGLGEYTLKQLSKFVLHRMIIKFLGMVLINDGIYTTANNPFVKVSMIQKCIALYKYFGMCEMAQKREKYGFVQHECYFSTATF